MDLSNRHRPNTSSAILLRSNGPMSHTVRSLIGRQSSRTPRRTLMRIQNTFWEYNELSATWMHPQGLWALMDPSPTKSGALRCIGPFSRCSTEIPQWRVLQLMSNLTIQVEEMPQHREGYVIWGTYRQCDPYISHELPLLGTGFFFTPNIALRSRLLRLHSSSPTETHLSREWAINRETKSASHRSGIRFEFTNVVGKLYVQARIAASNRNLDQSVFHPAILTDELRVLAGEASRLLDLKSLIRQHLFDNALLKTNH
jgi:hypothetical protein